MDILDTIIQNLIPRESQNLYPKVAVEGYNPLGKSQAQNAGEGNTFVLKENAQGGLTRLRRPESMPLTQEEQQVPFSNFLQKPQQTESMSDGGFNILKKLGQVTGLDGSSLWKWGADIDLSKGQPVPNAMSGLVEFVGPRGGFGNQVRVKGDDGKTYWYSHLDAPQVQVGQRLGAGMNVGLGGNTGNTIPGKGQDGSHLDLTVLDERGRYVPARSVIDLLKSFG